MLFILILSYLISTDSSESRTYATPITQKPTGGSVTIQFCSCSTNSRSLWDIIWSCLAVIFACTWIAVHPNIPALHETWWNVTWCRMKLMFWAIVAPEMIIFWAMRQWVGARRLARKYGQSHGWTKTHGFFVQMGGFLLYNDREPVQTLTAEEIEDLTVQGLIDWPLIDEEEIGDRSKGDFLGKGVAVFQTSWFVAQCIARGVQGLVITELELVTLAYALLNGVIYFFWWNKPVDVRYPVQVFLRNPRSESQNADGESQVVDNPSEEDVTKLESGRRTDDVQKDNNNDEKKGDKGTIEPVVSPMVEHQPLKLKWFFRWTVCITNVALSLKNKIKNGVTHFLYDLRADIRSKGLLAGSWTSIIYRPLMMGVISRTYHDMVGASVRSTSIRRGDCMVSEFYALTPTLRELIFFNITGTVISVSFGAIHCIAWTFQFPTRAEELSWRVASLLIVSVPFLFIVTIFAPHGIPVENRTTGETVKFYVGVALHVVYSYGKIFYIFARLSLLALAFASLRALEPGAYLSVDWINFIPHI